MSNIVDRIWLIRLCENASANGLVDRKEDASVFRVVECVGSVAVWGSRIGSLPHGTDRTDGTDALGEVLPASLRRTAVARMTQKWCGNVQIVRLCPPLPAFARLCPPLPALSALSAFARLFYGGPGKLRNSRSKAGLRAKRQPILCRMASRLPPPSAVWRRLAVGAAAVGARCHVRGLGK